MRTRGYVVRISSSPQPAEHIEDLQQHSVCASVPPHQQELYFAHVYPMRREECSLRRASLLGPTLCLRVLWGADVAVPTASARYCFSTLHGATPLRLRSWALLSWQTENEQK